MVEVHWFKIQADIFDNEKIKKLLNSRDGDTYCRVWFQLLALAAKCNAHGAVLLGENNWWSCKNYEQDSKQAYNNYATTSESSHDIRRRWNNLY